MPLYEYHCESCGHRFELIRKFSDPPLEVCPHCGQSPVSKLMSSPAIQFKGSGFYITDYAKKNSPSEPEKKKADSPSTSSTDNTSGTGTTSSTPSTSTTPSTGAAKPESK